MSANSEFGTFGRYKELSLEEITAEQRKAYDFSLQQRGQVPGPFKIGLQDPKLIEVMVPLGAYYQGYPSLSKAEIEIGNRHARSPGALRHRGRVSVRPDLLRAEAN
jgi:4-carboxymuconolactone decarboxylase